MSPDPWHVDGEVLAAYVRGDIDAAGGLSVDAHLIGCDVCQASIAQLAPPARIEANWIEVVDKLDTPRPGFVEMILIRVGVAPYIARLLAATPSLTVSWLGAVAVALGVAVAGAYQGERGVVVFLCVAALAPVAGVAATFGRGIDPTYELGLAAPMSSVRLLLFRTVAVVSVTFLLTVIAAVALPGLTWTAAAWLLPALGLTLASLALATYVSHTTAFGIVTVTWVAATIVSAARPADALAVFDGSAQLAFVAVIAAATLVLVQRRESLDGWSSR